MTNKPTCVIVDMDGTLADVRLIRHFVDGSITKTQANGRVRPVKNFDAFHEASEFVPANQQAIDFIGRHAVDGHHIVIVTARMEKWRGATNRMITRVLDPVGIEIAAQLHRADGDNRKDYVVKKEILAKIRETWDVVAAIDDNPNVITLWEEEGIPEIEVVPGWDEEQAAKVANMANRVV